MRKIIIAEDELAINKMLCMNLGLMGYETVAKYNRDKVVGRRPNLMLEYKKEAGIEK